MFHVELEGNQGNEPDEDDQQQPEGDSDNFIHNYHSFPRGAGTSA
jgi:hypothetical protein